MEQRLLHTEGQSEFDVIENIVNKKMSINGVKLRLNKCTETLYTITMKKNSWLYSSFLHMYRNSLIHIASILLYIADFRNLYGGNLGGGGSF